MSRLMRAVLCQTPGDVSVLSVESCEAPELLAEQVRIGVRAFGLNRADLLQRRGLYPPPSGASPILGLEVAGEILESSSPKWLVGQRVMALLAGGGYAEEVCVDAGLVLPMPEGWSFEQGAAVPEVFITAHLNLCGLAQVQPGERVLIHAGASGVGTAGIQLMRGIAKTTFVTVSTPDKVAACRDLGASPICYREEPFADAISRATDGRGVDVILDPVGASYLAPNVKSLATGGRLVLIGLMGGNKAELDLGSMLQKRLRIIGSTLRALPLAAKRAVVASFWQDVQARFAVKDLQPIVDSTFAVAEIRAAHEKMESNQTIGKLIVRW